MGGGTVEREKEGRDRKREREEEGTLKELVSRLKRVRKTE